MNGLINGFHVLMFAATIVGAFTMIPSAIAHDRRLEEPDDIDRDALADEQNQRYEDDADAFRKGES